MNLFIDTTNGEYIFIAITDKKGILIQKKLKAKYKQSEKLLPEIDKLITKVQSTLDFEFKISGIVIVNGPGPFTATRIGVTTGNALAYAWNVPIIGIKNDNFNNIKELIAKGNDELKKVKKNGSIIEPFYSQEPNITTSKKSY